jgi:threonine dehydratase
VVVTGAVYAEALEACLERQRETGALLTHAYDQPEVVAGAGTLAQEIEEQGGRAPDSVLVSVRRRRPDRRHRGLVRAAQPRDRAGAGAGADAVRAREAGEPVDVAVSGIAAIRWAPSASAPSPGRSRSATCRGAAAA